MKIVGREEVDQVLEETDAVSLCSMFAGSESFGIDTRKIREVLGKRELQRVPLAPAMIAGVVPYRGEVLTTVNFRALLGLEEYSETGCVLVLDDDDGGERFGLVVDEVGGVVTVNRKMLEENPTTLDAKCKWLFDGAYKMQTGLLVQLDPQKLRPSRLTETGYFKQANGRDA
ncbi:chemotaxis protein CheW [Edaphobacter acidisoli]|uniref:Chemotaxis protein CheW n=1 Tax=Edaphobacter acidisoli TaxID=2040573 RepID=A0A916RJB5_9BACT|nr:chemotaxis protein CheW [Edaphobacter acidisoli]GGA58592.1 chemotaxis protein CheW [Edaphobacter acidisoli]